MLKPDFKEKWLTALESGQYQQTQSVLHDGLAYCCLGAGCVVLGATFIEKGIPEADEDCYEFRPMLNDDDIGNGEEIIEQGLADAVGLTAEEQQKLYKMNDSGRSFAEIAAYIRKNL